MIKQQLHRQLAYISRLTQELGFRLTPNLTNISYEFNVNSPLFLFFFFLNDTATTEIYTLSLHDALPILIVMIGIVIAGPWLTVAAARWCARVFNGASPLLATRRLADNPKAAFRAVRGLVLAVFLGTMVGVLVPAVETFSATANASALNNVLLDTFENTQSTAPGPVLCSTLPASQRTGSGCAATDVAAEEAHGALTPHAAAQPGSD